MPETSAGGQPLPADRAFVVQLHAEADVAAGRFAGRVVHVVSGQTAHFETLQELLTFIARVLTARRGEPPHDIPDEP